MARDAVVGVGAIGAAVAAALEGTGRHELMLCARRPLAGRPTEIFAHDDVRAVASALARECAAVARAEGIALGDGDADDVVRWLCGLPPDAARSILTDRLAGRELEWEARNGVIGRLGRRHGVPTPVSDAVAALLHAAGGPAGRRRRLGRHVTPRGTDWSLALLVVLGLATGLATWFAGAPGDAWVFAAHAIGGTALALVLGWKLRRVWRRVADPSRWDGRTATALAAVVLVTAALGSGYAWSQGAELAFAGYNLLNWHAVLGALLGAVVLGHALGRAKPLRRRDVAGRRQFLHAGGVAAGAVVVWGLQRPVERALGLRGARRRFTGSYDAGANFPETSWVADRPRPVDVSAYRLTIGGRVRAPLALGAADLDDGDELTATLDCTGGFYTTRRWQGASLGRLLDRAGVAPGARHVRVISRTGYRWSFSLADARRMLLATRVDGEPLSHGHGAPCRLVAPGRRGFQWIKWVERIELHEDPDPGAPASTVWSSFTLAGRGDA